MRLDSLGLSVAGSSSISSYSLLLLAFLLSLCKYATFPSAFLFYLIFFSSLSLCSRICNVTEPLLCLPALSVSVIRDRENILKVTALPLLWLYIEIKDVGKKGISCAFSGVA